MGVDLRDDPDVESALDAMSAAELRTFVRDIIERLHDTARVELVDRLMARAAKSGSGWQPSSPSATLAADVRRFAEEACQRRHAEPHAVDAFLRAGSKAFLAGEHAVAREVFDALLPPLADGDIYLGQYELVDDALTVDAYECAAQYVVSVYATTPLEGRARAITEAIDAVGMIGLLWSPLQGMEQVAVGALPELDAFLPTWIRYLEEQPAVDSDGDDDRSRWLREAVLRLEGATGLERIARASKKPEALRAWCSALVERRQWAEALRAFDDAAEMVGQSHWRGSLLDGAALAAQQLGRRDVTKRLQAAWIGAPSLTRLLRWLIAGNPSTSTLSRRAKRAVARLQAGSGRQLGLLCLLTRNIGEATKLLAEAPGLGWSSHDHPGHVLFPSFAGMLADGAQARLSQELFAELQQRPTDPLELGFGDQQQPKLATPTIADVMVVAGVTSKIDTKSRAAMLDAMRSAATSRVEGILGKRRRRHYGHAAALVACCAELAPLVGMQRSISSWLEELRDEYSRFSAFQEELRAALGSTSC